MARSWRKRVRRSFIPLTACPIGRQAAYRAALNVADQRELEKAVARNIFGVVNVDARAARLPRYARAAASQLDTEEEGALAAGKAVFPNPEAFVHA